MFKLSLFCLFVLCSTASALDCVPIPDSDIFDGDQFWYPVNSTDYVRIPPNFNCTYVIKAPITASQVMYGSVTLTNLLKGPNDYMIVTDSLGAMVTLKYKSDSFLDYDIFPGKTISIQVVTKSVDMKLQFLIHVSYSKVKVGGTNNMKTGGILNYVNLATLRGFDPTLSNSITIQGNFNEFGHVSDHVSSVNGEINRVGFSPVDQREACQVLAVDNNQVFMTSLTFTDEIDSSCVARVVTGPPNNSSQLLLDLTKAQGLLPYTFNLKYFSVIAEKCPFSFTVKSPEQ